MENTNEQELKQQKYWITKGLKVKHVDHPEIKMTVDKILREKDEKSQRTFTKGVLCHWIHDGQYSSGKFRTDELKPWDE